MLHAALDATTREQVLDRLEREHFDVVVIGGGISGAGVAREASQRGLSVALVEAEDFASGTSSRSSKLIHGGLRYLAMGDVGLVRKTALERKEIHRLAPHLAEKRWLLIPTRTFAGHLTMRAAIATYEKLGAVEAEDCHRNLSGQDLEGEEPALDPSVYKYASIYREYLTDDAHLVLANLRSAAGLGAAVINRARVETILQEGDAAAGVEFACLLSERRVCVRGRCVVNAAGPWVDAVRRLEDEQAKSLLHLSKGVHLVLPAERLPVNHMLILNTADRRTVFVIRQCECVYIGTTDTTYAPGHEVWPEIGRADIEYLLEPARRGLRCEPIRPDEVVAAWAGLRPLIAEPGKKPHEISRRDEVMVGPARVITMAGGKLTGYRPLARETVKRAAEVCGIDLAPPPAEEPPLPGGDFADGLESLASALARDTGVDPACAARMVRLYGSEALEIARSGTESLVAGCPVLATEVDWSVRTEGAAKLEDTLYRRLRTAWYTPGTRDASVEPIGERMASLLGWSDERRRAEVQEARSLLASELRVLEERREPR